MRWEVTTASRQLDEREMLGKVKTKENDCGSGIGDGNSARGANLMDLGCGGGIGACGHGRAVVQETRGPADPYDPGHHPVTLPTCNVCRGGRRHTATLRSRGIGADSALAASWPRGLLAYEAPRPRPAFPCLVLRPLALACPRLSFCAPCARPDPWRPRSPLATCRRAVLCRLPPASYRLTGPPAWHADDD